MLFVRTFISFFKDKDYRDLLLTTTVIITVGTTFYHYVESWSWLDSLYFSVITLTTIGYGDFSPETDAGKMFTILYIMVGIGIILSFVNTVYNHYSAVRLEGQEDSERRKKKLRR